MSRGAGNIVAGMTGRDGFHFQRRIRVSPTLALQSLTLRTEKPHLKLSISQRARWSPVSFSLCAAHPPKKCFTPRRLAYKASVKHARIEDSFSN